MSLYVPNIGRKGLRGTSKRFVKNQTVRKMRRLAKKLSLKGDEIPKRVATRGWAD